MTATMVKTTCPTCNQTLAVVGSAPRPGSVSDYFMQLMVEAVADTTAVVGADEHCPHCRAVLDDSDDVRRG
jgi:hypothetical protein